MLEVTKILIWIPVKAALNNLAQLIDIVFYLLVWRECVFMLLQPWYFYTEVSPIQYMFVDRKVRLKW